MFEVGQYVRCTTNTKHLIHQGAVYRVSRVFKHKETTKDLVNVEGVIEAYYPSRFEEIKEDDLYHCSYCGKEGHNKRTCSALAKAHPIKAKGSEELLVKETIKVGDRVTIAGMERNDSEIPEDSRRYFGKTFEVVIITNETVITKSVDISGSSFASGENLHFAKSVWKFKAQDSALEEVKRRLEIWELAEMILPVSRLTLLYGPPGTGKTTAANMVPDLDGSIPEVYNITLTEETPAAELRGHFIPKGTEFIWHDGPAMTAFKNGSRLVLNEIDKASGDALTFCHALLDDPGIARITLPTGETLYPHEGFKVIATMNGHPDDLPEALRDRFAVRINIDKLHPNAVKSLPKDLQKAAKKGISRDSERSVSVRGWKAFAALREIVGEEEAALAVFGERAETVLNTIKISRAGGAKKVSRST